MSSRSITTTVKFAGVAGLGNVINYGLAYITVLLITQVLSPGDYGLFALTTTIVSLAAILARLGLENTAMRYVALYQATANSNALRGLLRFTAVLGGICGIRVAILLCASSATLETVLSKPGLGTLLRWGAIMVGPLALAPIWLGVLQGLHDIARLRSTLGTRISIAGVRENSVSTVQRDGDSVHTAVPFAVSGCR